MNKDFWHNAWLSGKIGFNQSEPKQLLTKYFNCLQLQPGDIVFVPLCGKSIDMLWLLQQGYKVLGVELSPIATQAFFKENNLNFQITTNSKFTVFHGQNITILNGDFFNLSHIQLENVAAVYDKAALIALPPQLRQQYAQTLINLLPPKIKMLLFTIVYPQEQMNGPPFSVSTSEITQLYKDKFTLDILEYIEINNIPPHIAAKGLSSYNEQVNYLFN
ncbi:MAG: thiopurine S-methyltransferase [Burkholderiales bacterium]|nr:thiopurine S-methyltransferase [Burkholderiales bacterium]